MEEATQVSESLKTIPEKTEEKKPYNFNYDKHYRLLLLIPVIFLILSLVYLGIFYSNNGDVMRRDVSLSGGTSITINGEINQEQLETPLRVLFPDVSFTKLEDITSRKEIALIVESSVEPEELKPAIEGILGYKLTGDNSSIEFTGAALSDDFYKQLIFALLISFVLMSIVIFILFRTFIPSIAVIFAVFADIVIPLAVVDYLGIKLSAAGIAAFLMLIGYSVDTDILLTSRVLKSKEGSVNQRIFGAFKTGIFMNLTALVAVLPAFFLVTGLPGSFRQIFLILALGLMADILNTWLTNASIIKWYCDGKGIK
ncbi:MAG TPA: protein translocase subunit SecF [Candidatus Nanoarchaeia archaeon]|nr:protein translocase subunit SecF [Candidatus Nanoarchaeia archaeon]